MKKKTVKPDRICFECLHYEACQSWNIGSLVKTAADNCVNYRASVDVRPVVRGYWHGEGDGYVDGELVCDMWQCSCCGEWFDEWDDKPTWNFCPNCGADMRGGEAGE